MNKELGRKITSLTLMTIMLTWTSAMGFSMTFMPEAEAANQYLWVSVEDAGGSKFYGGQVLEIVVTDPAINRLDEAYGMPDVTIDGKKVIMAQGVDGSWYAYIADGKKATTIDKNYAEVEDGRGADYGRWCKSNTPLEYGPNNSSVASLVPSESRGVAIPFQLGNASANTGTGQADGAGGVRTTIGAATQSSYTQGTGITNECGSSITTGGDPLAYLNASSHVHIGAQSGSGSSALATGVNASDQAINNVVREARALSNGTTTDYYGNIALGPNLWPFIQLYDFTRYQSYDLVYERGGTDETISLTYDRPKGFDTEGNKIKGLVFDKDHYGLNHEIGVTLYNNELNLDPTDEDSWTFGTLPTNATIFYQLFDENGDNDSSATAGVTSFDSFTGSSTFGFNDGGIMKIDVNGPEDASTSVLYFQDNGDQVVSCSSGLCSSADINSADQAVTFTETGANTGTFTNWDDSLKTNMYINPAADRGTQAVFWLDDAEYSVLHMPSWGSITFNTDYKGGIGSEWNSGELVQILLDDEDMNLDARTKNQMKIKDNKTIVPAIKIGSPITLTTLDTLSIYDDDVAGGAATIDQAINDTQCSSDYGAAGTAASYLSCYEKYSERAVITVEAATAAITIASDDRLEFVYDGTTVNDLKDLISGANGTAAYTYINYDFRAFNGGKNDMNYYLNFTIGDSTLSSGCAAASDTASTAGSCTEARYNTGLVGTTLINAPGDKLQGFGPLTGTDALRVNVELNLISGSGGDTLKAGTSYPLTMDFVTYGQSNDGVEQADRHMNSIWRFESKENAVNSGVMKTEVDFTMLNQLNVNQTSTYNNTKNDWEENRIIVHQDMTDEDEIRVNYLDMGADGVETQVGDQLAAPTHSGVVEFDNDSYKEADTVVITLTDADLNVNPDIINIYTVVNTGGDYAEDMVGKSGYGKNSIDDPNARLLDITFDDELWLESSSTNNSTTCSTAVVGVDGLAESGFTLVETGKNTGVFVGDFQVPAEYCARSSGTGTVSATMGTDIEVNYVDYRDASGEIIEVGDGAGIRGNTGSVSLDRTVYPVPFGTIGDFSTESSKGTPNGRALFPIHSGGITSALDASTETLGNGDLTIHIRVDDPDYDVSASGEDQIAENTTTSSNRGPLKIYVARGSDSVVLATAGGDTAQNGVIHTGSTVVSQNSANDGTPELGPILETAPDSGVFELDMTVRYTDGPASTDCSSKTDNWTPLNGDTQEDGSTSSVNAETTRFSTAASTGDYCILQGDVITVEYTDQNDASGNSAVAYDSATFDLRNGVIQTDKSVYIIGSDIIMTLIEPDLDLESDEAETWDLDLIEWDSDAADLTMGNAGGSASSFDPEPSDFRETGDSTGIFQIVIEVPSELGGETLDRGELIELEYTDWAPAGADYVGEEYTDIELEIYTSNFGATIEMDQKVYTWTDKIYVTIVAPDHNFDSGLVDMIGDTDDDPLIVQTRSQKLTSYQLAETGTDTGIFSGEVILKGFSHDADGDPATGDSNGYDVTGVSSASGTGPTNGIIKSEDDDGITVSYEYNEDEVVVGSALIRWNVGEVQWLESSYPAGGNGVVRVVDPDMNWDPENVDNFEIDVWSDSDAGGISLMITETNEATGIFEGTVSFTADDESSGHRLRVAEGDTITAEYEDNTLPDPYTRSDDLDITGTAIIGTVVPPLERAPAANARVVDSFGNSLSEVSVDQQVQIEADLVNGQDRDQSFAYLVQVQDSNGVTVSLAWITGQLAAGQSFSPALSWIPSTSGSYEATVFVWESVDNPTALSDTVSVSIRVV